MQNHMSKSSYFTHLIVTGSSISWFLPPAPGEAHPTWSHPLETYGTVSTITSYKRYLVSLINLQDVVYDDFISNFTASKFNASEWLDLFDNAGAKYFVLVTVSTLSIQQFVHISDLRVRNIMMVSLSLILAIRPIEVVYTSVLNETSLPNCLIPPRRKNQTCIEEPTIHCLNCE